MPFEGFLGLFGTTWPSAPYELLPCVLGLAIAIAAGLGDVRHAGDPAQPEDAAVGEIEY